MNQEQINRLSASLFRQAFLLKMLGSEYEYFVSFPLPSGIKNELHRMKNSVNNGFTNLKTQLPNSKEQFERTVKMSDEKISAMCNILEKLSVLDDEDVFKLEDDFSKHVKVKYA